MGTRETGQSGEESARRFLESRGCVFMARNYRTRLGELDLVMKDGDCVVFVEVKLRKRTDFGHAYEAVTRTKQEKIVKAALVFVKEKRLAGKPLRFDVVSIEDGEPEHIPNAFGAPGNRYTL